MQHHVGLHGLGDVDSADAALGLLLDPHRVFGPVRPDGRPLGGLGLTHLHRRQAPVVIADDREDHPVEVREPLLEVVRIPHVFDRDVRLVLLELPGPGADQLPRLLGVFRREPLRDVLRVHLHVFGGEVLEEQGARERDRHPDGPIVDHLGAAVLVEGPQDSGPDADRAGLDDPVQGELDVVRGDRFSIVPLRLAQTERVGLAVATDREALAQVADDLVGIDGIVVDEPVELRPGRHQAIRERAARVHVPLPRIEPGDALEDHLLVFPPGDPVRRPGEVEGLSVRRSRLRGRRRRRDGNDQDEQHG